MTWPLSGICEVIFGDSEDDLAVGAIGGPAWTEV
jgi:hypothetical protein